MATLPIHDPATEHRAYEEIRQTPAGSGFAWKQGSVSISTDGGLVELCEAMNALKALPWFPDSVLEVRAFRPENNSDFTESMRR